MKITSHLFSLSKNSDSLIAALIGFFLIQLFAKHSGIGVSPDSVTYIAATRHMLSGNGFKSFDFFPVVDFPFAYPFFLTVISFLTRLDPVQFGAMLNGFLFGILLYISGGIMNGFRKPSAWYKRILLLCILFSPALQEVYSMIWSETLFLLLILLFIISITRYLEQSALRWVLISAVVCALVCLTRYAGIFLWLTGCSIIFFNKKMYWRKRITHCFIFGSISITLLLVNIWRNLWTTGLATGIRPKSDAGLLKIMEYFGGVLCDWLLINRSFGLSVFLTIAVLLIFTTNVIFNRTKKNGAAVEYVIALTGLIYCGFMLFTYSITRYEQFTSRLLSPVYIPLLWMLSYRIPGFLSQSSYRVKWLTGIPVFLLAAWFLNIQLASDWEFYDGVKDAGIPGYREDPFTQSEIVQFLDKNKSALDSRFSVYSNAGDAVYFITGIPALQLPFLDFPDKVNRYYAGTDHHRPEYLVWFQNEENLQMPALDSILKYKNMVLVKQLADGAVYQTR
jgi:hypothetical protein